MKSVEDSESPASYLNIGHVVTILVVCAICLSPQMLIPRHNSIVYQSYWLEVNELMIFTGLIAEANMILELYAFVRHDYFKTVGFSVKMYACLLLAWHVPFISCNSFWKYYLSYNTPMPLSGLLIRVEFPGHWYSNAVEPIYSGN